jgi:hypothetical protein
MTTPTKKVKLTLTNLDGNCFALLGAFQKAARRQGWSQDEIKIVLDECMKGDYDHLLATLANVCDDEEDVDDGE